MIPGIGTQTETRLAAFLQPAITDLLPEILVCRPFVMMGSNDAEARQLGIEAVGGCEFSVVVTDAARKLGSIRVQTSGRDNVLFFDNASWTGHCEASIRILGSESLVAFNDIGDGFVRIHDLLMRSDGQLLFWGTGATAVGVSIEIEGNGRSTVIGDDALISNDVWLRNYDMHAIHDLRTGAQISRPPCDTVVERHVWLGQDALLLHCERVGMGAIVGARALLKGHAPPRAILAGTPARVIREAVSWGRSANGMTDAERASIGLPRPGAG